MGGLAKKMPITHATFLIATLAISGIYPLAGFFSKDEILAAALGNHFNVLFGVALFVAGLTAFYMFRIYFVTFWGPFRSHSPEHAHEAPFTMWLPLAILSVLSVVAGFFPMAEYVSIGEPMEHEGINLMIAVPATAVALLGIGLAWFFYAGEAKRSTRAAEAFGVIFQFVARPIAWFDRHVVDGGVNLSGWATRKSGSSLRHVQTGQVQTYGVWYAGGALFVLLILWAAAMGR
jgi:NADH-quinone oxidoreductase subunit L